MSPRPACSVILPTRNRDQFLEQAVASVLDQTRRDWELIVIDDGSKQPVRLPATAGDRRVRVVRHERPRGVSAARNHGALDARGEWIALLDDDDRWQPDYLERQLALAAAHPDAKVVAARCQVIDASGAPQPGQLKPSRMPRWSPLELLTGCSPVSSATMIRRATLTAAGGYDEALRGDEDIELYVRLAIFSRACLHDEVLVDYRLHGANWTSRIARAAEGHLRVCNKISGLLPTLGADRLFVQHQARVHYKLARHYWYDERNPAAALRHIEQAVNLHPAVGLLFGDSLIPDAIRWLRAVKPYALAGVVGTASLWDRLGRRQARDLRTTKRKSTHARRYRS